MNEREKSIEVFKGVSWWSWGDDIRIQLLNIRDVIVVHVSSKPHYTIPLMVKKGHHDSNEEEVLRALSSHLGPERCVVFI